MKKILVTALVLFTGYMLPAQVKNNERNQQHIYLDSKQEHNGLAVWKMKKSAEEKERAEAISQTGFVETAWMPAIVPGTVLFSLVHNKIYPDPYFGINNKLSEKIIPDISDTGRDFYTYWFRTEFMLPPDYKNKTIWLQVDGINYHAEVWLNGHLASTISGMFMQRFIDITDFSYAGGKNALAIKVLPVDIPGTNKAKPWRPRGENKNGGDGNIGLNTTMLMSVGWDFTFKDGIRDRNTGIWKSISVYTTGKIALRHPFVKSALFKPDYDKSEENVSVEVANTSMQPVKCVVKGEISGEKIWFEKEITLIRGEVKEVSFIAKDFPQLLMQHPRLWWPLFKGNPELYELKLKVYVNEELSDSVNTKFGIREIAVDRNSPDSSKNFYVNGKRVFIRGANWIPEAMLRNSDVRMYAELRYTKQAGINMLRLWGGGIAESDYFYQLCDEYGILVWQEFWLTGDTKHPSDAGLYFDNLRSTVKRIRNHPSIAFYVASNESSEVSGTKELLTQLDGTRPYQMQSEADGVHDGSPYQQVNPMRHYENTASSRGSRIDGFNPEYGAPNLPTIEALREMMAEKDLWPINKDTWNYLDGDGFHGMATTYKTLVDNYGESKSIDEFAKKAQLVGAINSKSIWETWNENKFNYGDRYCAGLLFWYLNSPNRQVCGRMWDWSLEPTASLYYTQNSLQPLHAQFDYLKNSVSVYNDYFRVFSAYKLSVEIYNMNGRKIFARTKVINKIEADTVLNNVLTLRFDKNISPVHFIKLALFDESGKKISDNFYWRSTSKYQGSKTFTGPATAGFEPLMQMKSAYLKTQFSVISNKNGNQADVIIKNTGKQIAFFIQLILLGKDGKPLRPAFYSDNFFSLLPAESKHITIETMSAVPYALALKGWNIKTVQFTIAGNRKNK